MRTFASFMRENIRTVKEISVNKQRKSKGLLPLPPAVEVRIGLFLTWTKTWVARDWKSADESWHSWIARIEDENETSHAPGKRLVIWDSNAKELYEDQENIRVKDLLGAQQSFIKDLKK